MNFSEKDRTELLYCLFEPSFAEIVDEKLRNGDTFLWAGVLIMLFTPFLIFVIFLITFPFNVLFKMIEF